AGELSQHARGVGLVEGLAEIAAVEHDLGVGAQDDGRTRRPLASHLPGLVEGDGGHCGLGRPWRMNLQDLTRPNGERRAEAGEELAATGRGGSKNQCGGAARSQPAAQETMRGFLSVMTRSFLAMDVLRNLGRLNECKCAAPFQ